MTDSIPSAETLAADLQDADPADVARLVADLPDSALREVVEGQWRAAILDEVFRRFPQYVDPERISGVHDAIEFVVKGGPGAEDRFRVVLDDGDCRAGRDLEASPRVTFELDGVDFLRLVTGNADAPVLVLTGRLRIGGDERFARDVGGFFRVPTANGNGSAGGAAGDVDPMAIARAIKRTPDRELRAGMQGAMREVVLDEIFRRFPEYLDAEKTRGVHTAIKWKLTGRPDGGADRYVLLLEDGACRVEKDAQVKPQVTITMDGADFLKLVTGNANPPMLFLRGRLRVAGDVTTAARLAGFFKIPSAG